MTRAQQWLLALALGALSGFIHLRPAVAQTSTNSCVSAFEDGQRQQLKGELERAAERFVRCAEPGCPARVRAECQSFLETARSSIPGVLFAPVDGVTARPLDGMSLSVDGRESRLFDGRIVRLEAGPHQLAFQRPGYASLKLRLTLRAGDPPRLIPLRMTPISNTVVSKLRPRTKLAATVSPGDDLPRPVSTGPSAPIDCAPPTEESPSVAAPQPGLTPERNPLPSVAKKEAPSTVPPRGGGRRIATLAAGIVGGLGAVGFVYFGLSARSADVGLDVCAPSCEPSKVDAIRRDYALANVSLGLGLAGVLTASALWLTSPSVEQPRKGRAVPPRRWALGVGPVTTLTTSF
jgi:hypothetical protein